MKKSLIAKLALGSLMLVAASAASPAPPQTSGSPDLLKTNPAFMITPQQAQQWAAYKSTLGPTFYNAWLPMPGLLLFLLMGMGPLLAWRKTSPQMFKRGFFAPIAAALVVGILHVALGKSFRFPALVTPERISRLSRT